jgi:predicted O-linked N-acetylglucosamine transferase (SPINDLY family)
MASNFRVLSTSIVIHSFYLFHREWGKRFMKLYPQYTSWDNSKFADRPLIIGYVSPDYFTHSVSYFIEAPLTHHEYTNYKVVVYSGVVKVCTTVSMFIHTQSSCFALSTKFYIEK